MEITSRKEENKLIVAVQGRIDAGTAPAFEKALCDFIAQGENAFHIDLHGLEYISSAGLRSLLVAAKQLKARQGEIVFSGLQGSVKDVFRISGFNTIFKILEKETHP